MSANIYEESARMAWKAIISKVQQLDAAGVKRAEISRLLGHTGRSAVTNWLEDPDEYKRLSFQDILRYFAALDIDIQDFLPPSPTMGRISYRAPVEIVQGDGLPRVPVIGEAGAGPDIELFSGNPETTIPVLPGYYRSGMWAVRVMGDSMSPLICRGAYVGVVPVEDLEDGGIYLVNKPPFGYVVKRVRMDEQGQIVLHSENPMYKPQIVPYEGYEDIIVGHVIWWWQLA